MQIVNPKVMSPQAYTGVTMHKYPITHYLLATCISYILIIGTIRKLLYRELVTVKC